MSGRNRVESQRWPASPAKLKQQAHATAPKSRQQGAAAPASHRFHNRCQRCSAARSGRTQHPGPGEHPRHQGGEQRQATETRRDPTRGRLQMHPQGLQPIPGRHHSTSPPQMPAARGQAAQLRHQQSPMRIRRCRRCTDCAAPGDTLLIREHADTWLGAKAQQSNLYRCEEMPAGPATQAAEGCASDPV